MREGMEIKTDKSVECFILSLEDSASAKVLRTIDLLERFGHRLGMPHSKKIAPALFELRVTGKQEVRLLYTFWYSYAVIVHGFIKKTQKTPRKEIEAAIQKIHGLR